MTAILSSVFENALLFAAVTVLVIIIRAVFPIIKKRYAWLMWCAVALRLVLPCNINISISSTPETSPIKSVLQTATANGLPDIAKTVNNIISGQTSEAISSNHIPASGSTLAVVWLVGIGLTLSIGLIGLVRTKYRVREAVKLTQAELEPYTNLDIRSGSCVKTPFSMGLINPIIYLPVGLTENEQSVIVNHEQMHIRHHDGLKRFLAFLITSVYWFSPVNWIAFFLFCTDTEYACDECALTGATLEQKQNYATVLLHMACGQKKPNLTAPSFGCGNIKHRISMIMKSSDNKKVIISTAAVILFASIIAAVSITRIEPPVDVSDIYGSMIYTEFPRICYADEKDVILWSPEIGIAKYNLKRKCFTDRITNEDAKNAGIDYMYTPAVSRDGKTVFFSAVEQNLVKAYSLTRKKFYTSSTKKYNEKRFRLSGSDWFSSNNTNTANKLKQEYEYSVCVVGEQFYFLGVPKNNSVIRNLDKSELIIGSVNDMSNATVFPLFQH